MRKTIVKSIGEILNLKRGYDLTKSEMQQGNIPVVGSNGIIGFHNKHNVIAPCVTVGRSGTVGIPQIYNENCWAHNTCLYIDDFKGNNPEYLFYLLKTLHLDKVANSTGVPTLNRNFVHPLKIKYFEDSNIQKSVSFILTQLDKKIELNNKINSELENLAKTLYEYWFVQFDFPDENERPYKSSGGKMIYNKELKREVPIDCEIKYVKDFLGVITGKEDANFSDENGQYAFFTCGDEILKCNQPAFSGKSILIAGNGNFNIKYYDGEFNAYQRTYVLIPNDNLFVGIIYLSALNRINAFTKGSNGSIVKFITKGDVENIPVIIPKNRNILGVFNKLLDKQNHIRYENENLKNLRDFLLPMLMNGQVTIQQ